MKTEIQNELERLFLAARPLFIPVMPTDTSWRGLLRGLVTRTEPDPVLERCTCEIDAGNLKGCAERPHDVIISKFQRKKGQKYRICEKPYKKEMPEYEAARNNNAMDHLREPELSGTR